MCPEIPGGFEGFLSGAVKVIRTRQNRNLFGLKMAPMWTLLWRPEFTLDPNSLTASRLATLTTASFGIWDNTVQNRNLGSEFVLLLFFSVKRSELEDMAVCFGCIFSVLFVDSVSRSMLKRLMS